VALQRKCTWALNFANFWQGLMPTDFAYATTVPGMLLYEFWTGLDNLRMGEILEYSRNLPATQLFHLWFMLIFRVLGLNLIIAMLAKTFGTESADVQRTWIFPFATMVLRLEQNLTEGQRRNCVKYRCGNPSAASRQQATDTHDADDDSEHNAEPRKGASSSWWSGGRKQEALVLRSPLERHEPRDWEEEFFLHRSTVISNSEASKILGGSPIVGCATVKVPPVEKEAAALGQRVREHQDEVMARLKAMQDAVVSQCEEMLRTLLASEREQLEAERDAPKAKEEAAPTAAPWSSAAPTGDSVIGVIAVPVAHSKKPAPYAAPPLAVVPNQLVVVPNQWLGAGWSQAQRPPAARTLPNAQNQAVIHQAHQQQGQWAAARQPPQTFAQHLAPLRQMQRSHEQQRIQQSPPKMPQPRESVHVVVANMWQSREDQMQPSPRRRTQEQLQQEEQAAKQVFATLAQSLPNVPSRTQSAAEQIGEQRQTVSLEQQQRSRQEYEHDMKLLSLAGLGVLDVIDTQQPQQGNALEIPTANHVSAASPGGINVGLSPNSLHAVLDLSRALDTSRSNASAVNAEEQDREWTAQARIAELEIKLEVAHSQQRARNAEDMARKAQDNAVLLEQQLQRLASDETRRAEALRHAEPREPAAAVSTPMHAAETQADRRVAEAFLQFDRDGNGTQGLPEFSEVLKAGLTQVHQEALLSPDPVMIQASASVGRVPTAMPMTAMPPAPVTAVQPNSASSSSAAQTYAGLAEAQAAQNEPPPPQASGKRSKRRPMLRPFTEAKPPPTQHPQLSPGKKREGMKKILVHEVVEGVVLEREEWVSDDATPLSILAPAQGRGGDGPER
jgi:hypothetical protein